MAAQTNKEKIETNSRTIALIKKDLEYMTKGIDEIKESINKMVNGFVTIEQYRNLEKRVAEMENLKDWAMKLVFGAIILTVLAIIGIGAAS